MKKVTINLDKAKDIVHTERRFARLEEFKKYDDIIAKRLPDMTPEEAEAQRVAIRARYAQLQEEINNCTDADRLLELNNEFKNICAEANKPDDGR